MIRTATLSSGSTEGTLRRRLILLRCADWLHDLLTSVSRLLTVKLGRVEPTPGKGLSCGLSQVVETPTVAVCDMASMALKSRLSGFRVSILEGYLKLFES
jgi:hypothetical protein